MKLVIINKGVCWNESISIKNRSRLLRKNPLFIADAYILDALQYVVSQERVPKHDIAPSVMTHVDSNHDPLVN